MKTIKRFIAVAIALFALVSTASAQISFGIKAGANIGDLRFEDKDYEGSTTAGFAAGLMLEYMFPTTSVGVDASLMYSHINTKFVETSYSYYVNMVDVGMDYIDLPINFKWKIGLPVARNIVTPYLYTGPCFSFLAGGKDLTTQIRKNTVDVDWNVGVGVQLFNKVQVGASYGWGLNNVMRKYHTSWTDIESKKDTWRISATYIF